MYKITEAYANRIQIETLCKEKRACIGEYIRLLGADSQIAFENVLLANFSWCVIKGILKEWLPDELPNCDYLNVSFCTSLETLPKLPNCICLVGNGCNFKTLPELPNCTTLSVGYCTSLETLPKLAIGAYIYFDDCTGLITNN